MVPAHNRRVVVLAYDGLCTFEFGVATELFGLPRPEFGQDWYTFEIVSCDAGPLRMLGGVTLEVPTDLRRLRSAGTIVVPGWRDPTEAPSDDLVSALRAAHARGARVMSICSGVFVLAAAGLLDGRAATTHWRYADLLATMHPSVDVRPDVLYVESGAILTSAGSAAGIDAGLHLIRSDYGASIANHVARRLVVPPHRDGGQAQFIPDAVPARSGPTVGGLLEWAAANLHRSLSVDDLARHAHLAPRTLARRFAAEVGTTPHKWLVHQRLAVAQRLLETTDRGIDQIARDVGFGTAMTMRSHFQRSLRTTPMAYRKRFATTGGFSPLGGAATEAR